VGRRHGCRCRGLFSLVMQSQSIRFIDLCAGLGGFHRATSLAEAAALGGRSLSFECVMAAELDPILREVYLSNFPDLSETYLRLYPPAAARKADLDLYDGDRLARIHGDLNSLVSHRAGGSHSLRRWPRGSGKRGTIIPDHDLLLAGFPCQPFSKSGRQDGFEDQIRGTIFGLIETIIREKKPAYVLLENVGNFERHDGGKTWEIVHAALRNDYDIRATEAVSGGSTRLGLLSPHHFGYPHHRERFFIVAQRSDSVGCFPPGFSPFPRNHRAYRDKDRRRADAERRCGRRLQEITRPVQLRLTRRETSEAELEQAELNQTHRDCIRVWNSLLKAVAHFEESPPKAGEEPSLLPLPSFPIWGFELDPWSHYPYESGPPTALSELELAYEYFSTTLPTALESKLEPPAWVVSQADDWEWWTEGSLTEPAQLNGWIASNLERLRGRLLEPWLGRWPAYAGKRSKWPRWKREFLRQNREFSGRLLRSLKEPDHWSGTGYTGMRQWLDELLGLAPSHQKLEWNCKGTRSLDLWELILQFRPSGLRAKRFQHVPALVALTTTQIPIVPRSPGERKRFPDRSPSRFLLRAEALELQGLTAKWHLPPTKGAAFKALGNAVHAELVCDILTTWLSPNPTRAKAAQLDLFREKARDGKTSSKARTRSENLSGTRA
jgi:DNA (cytosine-5)-methyltransferase 1